ncbi:type II toxin-antitoxin system death-on-curing family toxin [Enterobacter huaxiensis]|uniref:type II toxin-antitoxin system death-on-curing family toxin n=1 Tax=Enterobacter huaxiensis TaxID=2494702 RepID=UPI0021756D9F|nr:type II toxin-antitoxin system death-on-curing family toxin [Enterobacter huaxiensis]MCS5452554.1 type II toxin-antitoxin system death-on-curing family toxin [Enterobacter huaxiensis]
MIRIDESIVKRIHDRMIQLYGGLPGMPDAERVTAIIGRVEQTAYYTDPRPDVYQMAALYLCAIARGHIFNDANKRTALAVALFYLAQNGVILRNNPEDNALLVARTVSAATGEIGVDDMAEVFKLIPQYH